MRPVACGLFEFTHFVLTVSLSQLAMRAMHIRPTILVQCLRLFLLLKLAEQLKSSQRFIVYAHAVTHSHIELCRYTFHGPFQVPLNWYIYIAKRQQQRPHDTKSPLFILNSPIAHVHKTDDGRRFRRRMVRHSSLLYRQHLLHSLNLCSKRRFYFYLSVPLSFSTFVYLSFVHQAFIFNPTSSSCNFVFGLRFAQTRAWAWNAFPFFFLHHSALCTCGERFLVHFSFLLSLWHDRSTLILC